MSSPSQPVYEHPKIGLVAPANRGGASRSLRLEVPDPDGVVARLICTASSGPAAMLCYATASIDAAVARVRAAGGPAGDPEDRPYGRAADAVDDQGAAFTLRER